jgi:MEMO1 family protein
VAKWVVAGTVLILFSLLASHPSGTEVNRSCSKGDKPTSYSLEYHYSAFSDKKDRFLPHIQEALQESSNSGFLTRSNVAPVWGIVSHHLLLSDLIADFFRGLSGEVQPSTFVILGPNHFNQGRSSIAISHLPWKTPFGVVATNQRIIDRVLQAEVAAIDEDAFVHEHSIGALLPFLKFFFPNASVVTMVLRSDVDSMQLNRLAKLATELSDQNVFFLASLDFSHNKSCRVAALEDDTTIAVIHGMNPGNYGHAYVDSKASLYVLLTACSQMQKPTVEIVHHTNSGKISGAFDSPCTSYINALIRDVAGQ